jgi:hypothetical protein
MIYLSICGFTALCLALAAFSVSWSFTQSVRLLGHGISPSQGCCYLHTGQHKQNKHTQTSMPQVEFELTIPVFEWAKTVHALDHAATVISEVHNHFHKSPSLNPTLSQLNPVCLPHRLHALSFLVKSLYKSLVSPYVLHSSAVSCSLI